MYGGPLGAAAASAAVSKLTGDSWKSALTTGAISGVTAGLGSYASGVRGLGNIATTTGNTIATNAANAAATGVAKTAATEASKVAVGATPGFYSGLQNAGSMASLAPATISSMPSSVAASIPGTLGSGISSSVPGILTGAALPATGLGVLAPSNIMKAGYGVLGAGVGAAIPNKDTPATPLPAPYQVPYDPNNVFSWMRPNRGGLLPGQTPRSPIPQPDPINFYNQDMGYADGGDVAPVGMGLPQSAAMPQLMSAAQFGYLNARTGGMIAGPGDGKSDDIPALLSNGEHVIDAATVSDLGNGDNDTGQKRLEEIKHKIRSSAGRKNPRKASPKQKGLGSLLNSARA